MPDSDTSSAGRPTPSALPAIRQRNSDSPPSGASKSLIRGNCAASTRPSMTAPRFATPKPSKRPSGRVAPRAACSDPCVHPPTSASASRGPDLGRARIALCHRRRTRLSAGRSKTLDNSAIARPCQKMSAKTTDEPASAASAASAPRESCSRRPPATGRELLERLGLPFAVVRARRRRNAAARRDARPQPRTAPRRGQGAQRGGAPPRRADHRLRPGRRMRGHARSASPAATSTRSRSSWRFRARRSCSTRDSRCSTRAAGRCQTALVDVTQHVPRAVGDAEIEAYLRARATVRLRRLASRSRRSASRCSTRIASDDPTALIGLPLIRLVDMLRAAGVTVL